MQHQHQIGRRDTDIQINDGNHRQKFARQVDEIKNIRTEKDDLADQTEHLREEKQEKHITGGANFGRRKTFDKERPDTKNGKIRRATKSQTDKKQTMQIQRSIELNTTTQMPSNKNKLQMRKKGTICESLQTKILKQPNK